MNYLTKSRFVMATECARKLNYELDPRYPNAMQDDEFLKAIAAGGHRIGHLARLLYGGGTLIADPDRAAQAQQTRNLLSQPDATVYEGTVIHDQLLVRCDILVKRGNTVKLIEVKSKSCNSATTFLKGDPDAPRIAGDWESYLHDLTYQTYVLGLAFPALSIVPCLLLVNKDIPVSIAGLNSAFRISTTHRNVTVTVDPAFSVDALTPSILLEFEVSREVAVLRNQPFVVTGLAQSFEDFVAHLCTGLAPPAADAAAALPKYITARCKDCQFYLEPADCDDDRRSGWHQCMSERYEQRVSIARRDSFFGIYGPGRGQIDEFLRTQPLGLADMLEETFPPGSDTDRTIDNAERQRLQWAEHQGATGPHVKTAAIRAEIDGWTWPLHFIDFETASPSLPYTRGRRPYEQILFQFSHHVLHQDGTLVHRSQHLEDAPGVAASLPTLRNLMRSLSPDSGTVLHWWDHERNILKAVREQILKHPPPDTSALLAFIETLIGPKTATSAVVGIPRLKDLGRLISRTAFYPGTGGSSSIKKVLPAILKTSNALRNRYGERVYGTAGIPSLNFKDPAGFQWVVMDGSSPRDPYALLNPLIVEAGIDALAVEEHAGASEFVASGGAAMMAYERLQRPSFQGAEREQLITQLLRYCELDTLAMVMVFQSITGVGL